MFPRRSEYCRFIIQSNLGSPPFVSPADVLILDDGANFPAFDFVPPSVGPVGELRLRLLLTLALFVSVSHLPYSVL